MQVQNILKWQQQHLYSKKYQLGTVLDPFCLHIDWGQFLQKMWVRWIFTYFLIKNGL